MKILHEWHFHNRVCRVVESDPGIVHFEEATRTTGDPSIMLFNYTLTPMGAANEIIQLSMALAEANVINRELSSAIQRWQEERNFRDKEIEELRARIKELEGLVPKWVADAEHTRLLALGWQCGPDVIWHRSPGMIEAEWHWLMVPPIPLPEERITESGPFGTLIP